MDSKKKITVDELSVLLWLKVLDDYEMVDEYGDAVTALGEKVNRFDMMTADIQPQFFYDTVNKLEELGLATEMSLTETGRKIASALLGLEKAKIAVTTSVKETGNFIRENREDILGILGVSIAFLELVL